MDTNGPGSSITRNRHLWRRGPFIAAQSTDLLENQETANEELLFALTATAVLG